ncbi:hypothetical protein OS21_36530 [Dickeya oryzae]
MNSSGFVTGWRRTVGWGWRKTTACTKSVYGHDPDGLLFEVTWFIPADQLTPADRNARGIQPLDFDKELARFG